jgi:phosphatidylglycerol:prolipoprotein diacylglycerol transferase
MFPTLQIGSLSISTHLVSNLLTLALFAFWVRRRVRGVLGEISIHEEIDSVFYLFFAVLGGAWFAYTLPYLIRYILGESVPLGWIFQGTHWMGAIGGGLWAAYRYCKRQDFPFWKLADCYAPLLALALAIGRIGCYLYADAYGRPTNSWVGMYLPDVFGEWAYRYPTQIASMIINYLLAAILFGFEYTVNKNPNKPKGWPFDGFLFFLYMELYCLQRFYFEFWRGDQTTLYGLFSWTHLYCLIGIGLATWGMVLGFQGKLRKASQQQGV